MATSQIDYISFSVDLVNRIDQLSQCVIVTRNALFDLLGRKWSKVIMERESGWERAHGMRPYSFGYTNQEIGAHIHFGGHSNALIQFSGQGCRFLAREELLMHTINAASERMTRIDLAIDIETDVSPEEFCKAGYNNRVKSREFKESPSGETYYVGARTSAKFCRVYRYNEPHPRHKLLRVEYETKKAQARIVAECIVNDGISHTVDRLTKYYAWEHPIMPKLDDIVTAIPSEVQTRNESKTLTWLLKTCAPAFKRLVQTGAIEDPYEIFESHFLPEAVQKRMFDDAQD